MASEPLTIPACLEDARIKGLPSSAYYVSNFVTEEEERTLLKKIRTAPKPRWKQLSKRRLQIYPSDLSKNNTLLDGPLPSWLADPIISRILSCPITSSDNATHAFSDSPHKQPNHVLINEYAPGQGIMPHKDGDAYHPIVCTVSLGSALCLDIYGANEDGTRQADPRWKFLQEPRSLLITTDEVYKDFLHGISEVSEEMDLGPETISNWELLRSPGDFESGHYERQIRTSLTYRDVVKVSKLGTKLGIFGKAR